MKYSIAFFAATAAAYDSYGGYGAQQSSSAPVAKVSSAPAYGGYGDRPVTSVKSSPGAKATPCSTVVGSNGYTTVVPGYGKPPVTVTQQHQSYPTCVAKGYDGKSCDKWEDDKYVSTTITDYNKKVVTITKVQDYVTVYHEKKTITHYATPAVSTPVGGYGAAPTPVGGKNATGTWYELYEKVITCEYQKMGKNNGLTGYSGPGLCQKCDDEQEVVVKEYKGGKWSEEKKTLNYGKPKDEVKVYEKPGVYTVPAKVVTIYGSQSTGKPSYEAGIYHFDAKTITITKANQPYTCTYDLPKQTPSKPSCNGYDCKDDTPGKVTKTPTHEDYGYKASATPTPKKPTNDYPVYPNYPVKSNTTSYGNGYADKPTPTPVYGDYYQPSSSVPSKPTSTPCDEDKKKHPTPTPNKPVYDNGNNYGEAPKPTPTPAKPVYDNGNNGGYGGEVSKPTPTPAKPVYENNNAGYGGEAPKPTPTPAKPAYPADPSSGYGSNTESGKTNTGYTKRGGMIERRLAAVEAQKAKRNNVL